MPNCLRQSMKDVIPITVNKKEKAVVFGIGSWYEYYRDHLNDRFEIVALVDSNIEKQGEYRDGIIIEAPEICLKRQYDCIVVPNPNPAAIKIKNQLLKMGIPVTKMRFTEDCGIAPFSIDTLYFADNLNSSQKRKLFAENVERVIIEVNSKCNRQCWFCTNSLADRHSENVEMTDELFSKIINELSEISYDSDICLSFFNEPLLCEKLFERIKEIRLKLPKSYIYAFSNGDYLTKENTYMLSEAGLNLLWVDIYTNDVEYKSAKVNYLAAALIERIGLPIEVDIHSEQLNIYHKCEKMDIGVIARDFTTFASNRAESLPPHLTIPKIKGHPLPCLKRFISFSIDYLGDVWPCPNYHRDIEKHKEFCLGSALDDTIFDIYLGKKIAGYYERHLFHRETLPCRSCIWNFYTFIANRFENPFRDRPGTRRVNY